MKNDLPGDPTLPPGVSLRDIDPPEQDCPDCEGTKETPDEERPNSKLEAAFKIGGQR